MTMIISGSSPSITFSDSTTQTTAFTSTPSVTSITTSADASIHGLTVGLGAGSVSNNTVLGLTALASNTTGARNVAIGQSAFTNNSTATNTVAIGYNSAINITGGSNVSLGAYSLYGSVTPANNTATNCVAIGFNAMSAITSGTYNVGIGGAETLTSNTSGAYNVGIGAGALQANTTASGNTAVGYQAGYTNQTGTSNSFFGYQAGNSTTTSNNTFIGFQSGLVSTGTFNTFLGSYSGYYVTSGAKNTIIGGYNGNQGGLDIRTASNYIVLSDGDGNPRSYWDSTGNCLFPTSKLLFVAAGGYGTIGCGSVGLLYYGASQFRIIPRQPNNPTVASDNAIDLGDSGSRFGVIYAATGTINTSDANEKQDIQDLSDAEKRVAIKIKSLFKTFRFKDAVAKKEDDARIHVGVIAQDVRDAFISEGLDAHRYALFCSDTWYTVDGKDINDEGQIFTKNDDGAIEHTRLGVRYGELLSFVISAM